MDSFSVIAVLITLAAGLAYLNHHITKMPMTIGLMVWSLAVSLIIMGFDLVGLPAREGFGLVVTSLDFSKILLEGMLGLLLFAGALHVNLDALAENKLEIGVFATLGVAASTLLVGSAVWLLNSWLGFGLRFIDCLLFGSLISPTDPIAVLGILKTAGAPESLETKIAGESLFNDGVGVVVFLLLLELAEGHGQPTLGHFAALFAQEAVGGAVFGLIAGYITYRLLRTVNEYNVEVLLTLALAIGGYALALNLHLSAPIAIVLAGLLIGNPGRRLAMSAHTRAHLDNFWELVDAILNAVLFVLIGLEVVVLSLSGLYLLAGLLAVPVALASRLISVGAPVMVLRRWRTFAPRAVLIMTWGGLRGGISVALALSIPAECGRDIILTMTYVVVAFSVTAQGLTVKHLVKK